MVVGYECPDCGFQHECDVDESGERICPCCKTAVTGITGDTRGTRTQYDVTYREPDTHQKKVQKVAASHPEHAFRQVKKKVGDEKRIVDISIV